MESFQVEASDAGREKNNHELKLLGESIIFKRFDIALEVHRDRLAGVQMTKEEKREFEQLEPHILDIRANFIQMFGQALIDHEDQEKAHDRMQKWGQENANYFFNMGVPLDEALKDTSFYRRYIWKALEETAVARGVSIATIFRAIPIIDPLLDKAVYYFSLAYVQFYQMSLENSRHALLELSVPVVPLMEGTGVLPLIGNIDAERAKQMMEKTLENADRLDLSRLIIDLSGVSSVDTMVGDRLVKLISALSLIGVNTILTGIRPEVAQTIVNLGINLKCLTVKSNLHQAFKEIQKLSLQTSS